MDENEDNRDPLSDLRYIISEYPLSELQMQEINGALEEVSSKFASLRTRVLLLEGSNIEQEKIEQEKIIQLQRKKLNSGQTNNLAQALATTASRKTTIFEPLVKALAGGIVAKAHEECVSGDISRGH